MRVSAATFSPGEAPAPGSAVAVFGTELAAVTEEATGVPLSETLGQASVRFNGSTPAPLFDASPDQVNIQIPWELEGQAVAELAIATGAQTSAWFHKLTIVYRPTIPGPLPHGRGSEGSAKKPLPGRMDDRYTPSGRGFLNTRTFAIKH